MQSHTGKVYDIDYVQDLNWTQIALRGDFIGFLRELRMQSLLQSAMSTGLLATVSYEEADPHRIVRVAVRHDPPPEIPGANQYRVVAIEIDETNGKFSTTFLASDGQQNTAFTRDSRMELILLDAFRERWKIQELIIEANTSEILRGKVNLDTR